MQDEAKAPLFDMARACSLIMTFTAGRDLETYRDDDYCKSAVERQFLILGEALNRLQRRQPEIAAQIPSNRTIINFRNILAHGYDRIADDVVWGIVTAHVPVLLATVKRLIQEDTGA